MKSFHRILVLAVFVCTGTLQIAPAAAQLKTQTVEYKQADTVLEGDPFMTPTSPANAPLFF